MDLFRADISLWHFPASLILAAAFLAGLWTMHRYYASSRPYRLLTSAKAAVALTALVTAQLAVEGVWAVGLYHTWPFIGSMLLLMASLGLVTLRRLRKSNDTAFVLNHAGLFIVLWGALFGAPDKIEARMMVRTGQTAALAYTPDGVAIPLPFGVRLERFTIDYYDDGRTPRQFRSEVLLGDRRAEVAVNSPVHHAGYNLYQDSYDTQKGDYTVLLITRDRWLWVLWWGVGLLAAGSLLMLFKRR